MQLLLEDWQEGRPGRPVAEGSFAPLGVERLRARPTRLTAQPVLTGHGRRTSRHLTKTRRTRGPCRADRWPGRRDPDGRSQSRPTQNDWLTAGQLAARLGVTAQWVYDHQNELGVVRLGSGRKPRLRFPPRRRHALSPDIPIAGHRIAANSRSSNARTSAGSRRLSVESRVSDPDAGAFSCRARKPNKIESPGPSSTGTIVKRWRKRDGQYIYGLKVRAYGERFWVPLGTEREGWNERRAADRRDEIAALIRRGAWTPPDAFDLDPREKNPGFHEFATDWLARYRRGKRETTAAKVEYLLTHHALPFLKDYRLDEIDYAVLSSLVARRLQRNDEIEQARAAGVVLKGRDGRQRQAISPRTINMTLDVISRILADAVKRGLLVTNPASDPQLRLRVSQRRGNFLEADELFVVLEAAGTLDHPVSPYTFQRAKRVREMRAAGRTWKAIAAELEVAESTAIWLAGRTTTDQRPSVRRALLATLACAGLRNSEACDLNLGDLDFARGTISIRDSKTEAGVRKVDMTPWLREELLSYRASRIDEPADAPAFPTRNQHRRDRAT